MKDAMTKSDLQLTLRPAADRGMANFGWLQSAHSFSFGNYYDPDFMGFGNLRVINDDKVAGGRGFPNHPHKNAEIFSYVTKGALEHRDSMGNGSVVGEGGIQYMSAGRGVTHSEFNPSDTEDMQFHQIWLMPAVANTEPAYDTRDLTTEDKDGKLKLFLSSDGRDGSMVTQADASVYAATLTGEQQIDYDQKPIRKGWVQVIKGSLTVNGTQLTKGDGLAIEGGGVLTFAQGDEAEFLLFGLAA